ncbi:hypothetical protein NOS3756_09160 [Nostoc sp. NIES-3756]|uniref:hypothetical protein n=1 Tax=Nostoc sp. NIES-3756 TaxID=1751286 RepID=UPI000722169F|nr:hypothetical protein [Nostoc sp. NIES-3756]BAT51985.1 hypothetical protein NOS3756_09160 [Nostoc sp. NIES-3756]BAY40310.1 hypothetical protein NIES2111_46930 [Nostoc sp. NIES-2111]
MSDLIYPTLDLFIYALKTSLNTTESETQKNKENFLAQLPPNTQFYDPDIETEYLEVTHPAQIDFISQNKSVEGYYYPVRLNDTYGLQIDCSINNQIQAQAAKSFITLKSEIEQQLSKQLTIIGQTWMVSGWLPENLTQNPEDIAKDCYYALFPGNDWQPNQGTFLDGKIYEIWRLSNTNQSIDKVNNPVNSNEHHVIIVIYPHRESAEQAAEFYSDWLGLFCYRHKISWAYWQSRLVKESLLNHYKKIEEIKNITNQKNHVSQNQRLTIAHQLLNNIDNILQQYTIDLIQLSFQKEIIEINLSNYQTRFALIKEKAGKDDKLDFLEKFGDLANKKYLPQITRDIENMQLGLQLLEDTINATRSRIEVEKAERDRNFQELVAVAGSVIATATLLQSPAKDFCTQGSTKDIFPKIPYFCEYPFSFSLVIAFFIGFVVWSVRKRLQV